jgi:Ras-related protein Rab-1A
MNQSNKPKWDHVFKIIVIGDSCAGKSSLVVKFVDDEFSENFCSTIGIDIKIKTISFPRPSSFISGPGTVQPDLLLKLMMYDTAGQCRFRTLSQSYYRGADGCLLLFDVTDRKSFDRVETWLDELKTNCIKNITPILVGNKIDLRNFSADFVTTEEIREVAEKYECKWFETSAKQGFNVKDVFDQLTTDMLSSSIQDLLLCQKRNSVIDLSSNEKTVERKCC